ncbi:MAG: type II toxin-antitoxin system death-on-curing family toxin [Bdellovibrionales bacterium]
MQEPHWITKAASIAMHNRQLAEHGGGDGIRDETLLESALDRPKNLFFYSDDPVDTPRMAASYAYGIANNHPFVDGNKRTALAVSQTFLALNGYKFSGSFEEEYKIFLDLAAGKIDEQTLAQWFADNTEAI